MTTKRIGVVIGRFQPVHRYHITKILAPALMNSDILIVGLGSSLSARNSRNPWRWVRRQEMIDTWLGTSEYLYYRDKTPILYMPLKDYPYSNTKWQMNVQKIVNQVIETYTREDDTVIVTMYGGNKDNSTEYLEWFPQWNRVTVSHESDGDFKGATSIRETILETGNLTETRGSPDGCSSSSNIITE